VDVISLRRWRCYCYFDELDRNVLRQWFFENQVTEADRIALQALLDIYEYSGPRAIAASVKDLGGGFYALLSNRKGGIYPCPVFCSGPYGEEELTFLAGARWNQKLKRPEPRYVAGIAEERLEALQNDRNRRRLERFT
jgi:hypothetical protein